MVEGKNQSYNSTIANEPAQALAEGSRCSQTFYKGMNKQVYDSKVSLHSTTGLLAAFPLEDVISRIGGSQPNRCDTTGMEDEGTGPAGGRSTMPTFYIERNNY